MIFRWWSCKHCSEQVWFNRLWMGYQECIYRFCSLLAIIFHILSKKFTQLFFFLFFILKGKCNLWFVKPHLKINKKWTSGTDDIYIISSSFSSSWIWCASLPLLFYFEYGHPIVIGRAVSNPYGHWWRKPYQELRRCSSNYQSSLRLSWCL